MYPAPNPDNRLLAAPVASSQDRPWGGVGIDVYEWKAAGRVGSGVLEQDVIGMRISGTVRLTQVRGGQTHSAMIGPGNIGIHPRGMPSEWAWDGPGAIMLMRVPPALLQQAAETSLRGALPTTALVNCFSARDPFVERIVALFLAEIEGPPHPAQAYVSQALSSALALHLVHRFNCQLAPRERAPRGLNPRSLQRVKEFIDAHLHEEIDLQMLAGVANVSRFHFARLFRHSTGCSAMAYLERMRMARAQALIRHGRLPLSQVAALVGYADQSYFTRRFRLAVGVTPARYARLCAARSGEWR
ncbi:helix-turn-helix domain-containing protein [Massilia sp. HP4]|uniref:helix-turn-helix domain-containing protein n=1 Tax=Massilia sp. HP4 TaxID=2562316 RepID=UPI0010C024E5|nr:AraC family transcriptional regulator [Massilia sp. HP4]